MSESIPPDGNKKQPTDDHNPPITPIAVAAVPVLQAVVQNGLTVVVGGGVAFLFASAMLTPAVGATRSARLSQGQRRQAIAEAIQQINAEKLAQTGSPQDLPPIPDRPQ